MADLPATELQNGVPVSVIRLLELMEHPWRWRAEWALASTRSR
jgi:hypothetical protein